MPSFLQKEGDTFFHTCRDLENIHSVGGGVVKESCRCLEDTVKWEEAFCLCIGVCVSECVFVYI